MYGDNWKKGKLLAILVGHEMHHRSQMTIIMRMVNLSLPGILSPSRENANKWNGSNGVVYAEHKW